MASLCCCFVLLVVSLLCGSRPRPAAGQLQDLPTMVALQRELMVVDWDPNSPSTYCSWRGVTCAGSNQTVVALDLPRLGLRGNISLISELLSLKRLDLSSNSFHGSIPSSFGNLALLEFLDLSMNKFENWIPSSLGRIRNLKSLNLSNNLLSGEIPDEFKYLERLQELQISGNNLSGSIPDWVGSLTDLRVFSAYENSLVGVIPNNLGSVSQLEVLNLHSNLLEGVIPESIFMSGKLQVLVLTVNRLNGSLPASVGNCQGLSSLRIGNNRLVGSIPVSIGNVSSLTYFEADNNHLSGEIVPEFAQCSNLTLLNLASNSFTGTIPEKLGELKNLQEFIVSDNILTGEFPKSILRCRNLSKLDLSFNRFKGSLPEDLCDMSRLQFLLLDHNSISGEIPRGIGNCIRLLELHMGSNYLTGKIPPEIGKIKNLQIALNLSFNHFRGPLPQELGRLDKLVSLDVSNNQLSGDIPSELKGMLSLIEVNFSNNHLSGQIPIFGPFQKSPRSSFSGNKDLCGDPLDFNCGDYFSSVDDSDDHKVSYKIILAVVGSGLTVFTTVSVVVSLFMLRERQEMDAKGTMVAGEVVVTPPQITAGNVFIDSLKQAIDFDCAVKATLKDSNKLSNATFSTTYKVVMPSGLVLSVKKLKSVDRTVVHHQNKMIRELERLGNLCHANLMRPIGYVIYEDVALLLHHHMPNGTLAQLLHSTTGTELEPDWPRRLSIAIGVAEGLAYLHHTAIIHLDISSGNIFLDANSSALIGEIEISKLLDPSKGTASISAVAGSFGYIPPEYAYTMQVTVPGNVYSFGVVLLEILTSRLPVDEAFGEGIDLVKWVHNASGRGEAPEQIMDARLSTVSFAWRKQMLAVLKVAMLCTENTPAKRPKMKKAVEMLLEAKEN
uniref:non-specific serine/threonine protein kinase n=1 Tax=Elaeis guineensis var. tenera TaxID=51953 RepID=A0A6J0PIY1_ELAGV|nr:leucine-rich repeat receptor-like tyrosine-protein kinase PXC3 [Elaeis guineensis]XP_019706685.1 leucine-rich repeat receptor-like tyrosine-protein kinase PXC3 [Elaeis guineensis]XP_029120806.1 leucine-rich repeat receptor-like tyrosine-protein kinase PXC3 [Elaeis guineensis]